MLLAERLDNIGLLPPNGAGERERFMTERLYYSDSYLKSFSGAVLEQRQEEANPAVVLDRTAFYPESGGQPCDTGTLGEARVLKVVDDDSGRILHVLDRPVAPGAISGQIDWARRFDHMQQHTAQHILSQAFLATAKAPTLSFHLGQESSTIDIALAQPSAEAMEAAQGLATAVVFENRPVRIVMTNREGLASLGIRKESEREGEIRVIDVDGFDKSACGGTHVRNTGEIGLIFISGFERYKGGTRVSFVAGGRALKLLQRDHDVLKLLANLHSAAIEALPGVSERLIQERSNLSRENEKLRESLIEAEAETLFASAAGIRDASIVRCFFTGRSLEDAKVLARRIASKPKSVAILGLADAGQAVVARSLDLPGSCNDAVKKAIAALGGKGGGRPELAQAGGIEPGKIEAWLKLIEDYFSDAI